jgi:GNAT superfamily N-acetyltransferase
MAEIRPMVRKDKAAIMKILRATPEFTPGEVKVAAELIDIYLRDGTDSGYHVRVAEADTAPVGYICYGPTPLTEGTWDIYWMAVAAERQRQGIGRALMESAETLIREAAGRLALIETSSQPGYENTRRFHEGQGYRLIARIPDFYTPGDDKLILEKVL